MSIVFCGIDPRSPIHGWVCISSIARHASKSIPIVPLFGEQSPIDRVGLTSFTYARYGVPLMCNYDGPAIFMDSDVIVRDDIWELFDYFDDNFSVQIVDTAQKFERPSLMLFNCNKCLNLTKDYIEDPNNMPQSFDWADHGIGFLPKKWNFIVDYDVPTSNQPSLIHYTAGSPAFAEQRNCAYANLWYEERDAMLSNCSWMELMASSVHVEKVTKRLKNNEQTYLR